MKNNLHTVRTSYNFYKGNTNNPVSALEYRRIVYQFFVFMLKELFSAKEVIIPCKLGSLQIIGKKKKPKLDEDGNIKGLSVDWKETKALWSRCESCKDKKQLVFHFNEHTNGIRYKFKWTKKNVIVANKGFYYFKPSRYVKRELAKLIKQGKEFFIL